MIMNGGNTMKYDPWEHAKELGIQVHYYPLKTYLGYWLPQHKTILIKPRLRSFMEHSVLAHELVHAEYNDPAGHFPKHEARANRIAASRLIDPRSLQTLLKLYPLDDNLCHELGVSRELLLAIVDRKIA